MDDLRGKTALVIGGSSGIGLALAKGFATAGAGVSIAARTADKVLRAVDELRAIDQDARGFVVDVSENDEIDRLFAEIVRDRALPDILVNCQGTTVIHPSVEVDAQEYDRVMNTNLRSVFFCCTRFGAAMQERGSGAIINIASLAAHRGWPNAAVYAMSKHGVLGLTRTLGAEWGEAGVRVNSISPGVFLTDLNRERMSEERKNTALSRTPAKRFGALDELVGAALFLASDQSGFITGTDIAVDGGFLAKGI